jgi:hypothetical protein
VYARLVWLQGCDRCWQQWVLRIRHVLLPLLGGMRHLQILLEQERDQLRPQLHIPLLAGIDK